MVESNETSPLLTVETNSGEASNSRNDITSFPEIASYTAARDFFPRPIKIITLSILIASAVSFVLLLASDILVTNAPFESHWWGTRQDLEAVAAFVSLLLIHLMTHMTDAVQGSNCLFCRAHQPSCEVSNLVKLSG